MIAAIFWERRAQEIPPDISETKIIGGYKQAARYYLMFFGISVYSWVFFWVHGRFFFFFFFCDSFSHFNNFSHLKWFFFSIAYLASDNNFLYLRTLVIQYFNGEGAPGTNLLLIDSFMSTIYMIYWVYLVEGAKFTARLGTLLWQSVVLSPAGAIALYNYERYLRKGDVRDNLESIG